MDSIYMFPFEKVPVASKIIIYGVGQVGQSFLLQLELTNFCKVVAVADRAYNRYPQMNVPLIAPEKINYYDFDYAVIAIDGTDRINAIAEHLKSMGIPDKKIIGISNRKLSPAASVMFDVNSNEYDFAYKNKEQISVAIFLAGGLGDCIIAKKFITALAEKIAGKFSMDLYGDIHNLECIKSFFADCDFVANIFMGRNLYYAKRGEYDLALRVLTFVNIDVFNRERTVTFDSMFAETVDKLQAAIKHYELSGEKLLESGIHFNRLRYTHKNCYTFFAYGGVLDITDRNVKIPLDENAVSAYNALNLPAEYITINYGWGNNIHGEYKPPNKVWPFEYYETLINLVKKSFPHIHVVQTGMQHSPKLPNADSYVFNKNIDVLEYVLKNSWLHIDCESGLVHLATQLGTKCAVMFGPTDVETFGYDENINIAATVCGGCRALFEDFSLCLHENEDKMCMYSITPEIVFERITRYLGTII